MTTDPTTEPLRFAYWVPNVSGGLVTGHHRAAHRLVVRVQPQARPARGAGRLRLRAEPGPLHGQLRRRVPARVHQLQPRAAAGHRAAQADRRGPPRPVAPRRAGQVGRDRRPPLGRPGGGERRLRLVQRRVPPARRAVAGARRALPPQRRVHPALKRIWTEDKANLAGDFYRIRDFSLKPKPLSWPGRPHPEIFQGGNSTAARRNGGQLSDWYFSNGKDFDGVREQLTELRQIAAAVWPHRRPQVRPERLRHRPRHREGSQGDAARDHREGARRGGRGLRRGGQAGGRSPPPTRRACGPTRPFEDLVQYNDGFRTKLIGTAEQVAGRIVEYRKLGVDLILTGFLHYHEESRAIRRRGAADRARAGSAGRPRPGRGA